MDVLSLIGTAPALIGFVLPPFIELINRIVPEGKGWIKFLVTVVVCLLVATLLHIQELNFSSALAVLETMGIVFMESQVVFNLYFKNSALKTAVNNLGVKTAVVMPERVQ